MQTKSDAARAARKEGAISPDEIRRTVAYLVNTVAFRRSPQLVGFLTYIVDETLSGRGDTLKSYLIATEVFGRAPDFDPATDAIVRVEARRLRETLAGIYERHPDLPIVIEIPIGRYKPVFSRRDAGDRTQVQVLAARDRPGEPGHPLAVGAPFSDPSELARALHIERTRLSLAMELADFIAWDFDSASGQLAWSENARELLQLGPGSLETFCNRVHPLDRGAVRPAIAHAAEAGIPLDLTCRLLNPAGGTLDLVMRAMPVAAGAPRSSRLVGVAMIRK